MDRRQYIYKISFQQTHKVYIGKTLYPKTRWNAHKNIAKRGKDDDNFGAIHAAILKYGIENAIFEVIATCLKEEYVDEVEMSLIKQYNSFGNNGYNMTIGGEGNTIGNVLSSETRKKMSIARLGKKCPEHSKRMSARLGNLAPNSKVWNIFFDDGTSEIVDNLVQWATANKYNYGHIQSVSMNHRRKHKDIIRVVKVQCDG